MSWLAAATKAAGTPKVSIIQTLKSNMAEFQPARDPSVVHASDITNTSFCPRAWVLRDQAGDKPKGQWISTALKATFDLGHATAKELIENWGADTVVGHWDCKSCKAQRTFSKRPTTGCTKTDRVCNWEYREVDFQSVEYAVSGSLDVLFDLGVPKLALTELKTYAADEFDKMLAPLPEHRIRTQVYMKIVSDSGSPYKDKINLHEARVLYVSRGFGRMNKEHNEILPFREFVVPRDDQDSEVQLALNKGKQIKLYRENQLMPSGLCGTPLDKQAKACKYCSECFSGKKPAQQPGLYV